MFVLSFKLLATLLVLTAATGTAAEFYQHRQGRVAAFRFWSVAWKVAAVGAVAAVVTMIWNFPVMSA